MDPQRGTAETATPTRGGATAIFAMGPEGLEPSTYQARTLYGAAGTIS